MITHKRTIKICLAISLLALFYSCNREKEMVVEPISKEFNDEYLTGKGLDTIFFNTTDVMQYYQVANCGGLTADQILARLHDFSMASYPPSKLFLENQGKLYDKGLFAHSPSVYSFLLNKQWKKFSAIVGLRDYAGEQGAAKFIVIGDGKVLYQSPVLRVGQQDKVNIDITNVNLLELKADTGTDNNFNSWAVWLDPLIERQ